MNTLLKAVLVLSAIGTIVMPFTLVQAEGDAAKPAKQMSCKQEAKKQGLKKQADVKAYVKECEQKRKAAKAQ